MNRNLLTLAICVITLGSLSAQSFISKINSNPNPVSSILAEDTVKILAVMVNFQEDRDGATFGNGKFGSIYSLSYGDTILDPLPHDRDYFESHLTFVQNYYQKVSNGKVTVQFTILPDTFSVTKTMRNYSPTPGSDDFTPMGDFAQEVWANADQMYTGFPFADYNLFVIFHAGVGRDISLPGSIGNERDLPSVYLGENSLKKIYGASFNGFPVSNGAFKIKNSMIIPETESRELETITGKSLFEITINGLLVASVASHLGLPDLFDTETGLSAIGRFGLMDGQSIFAYNGCFPSEPSAWEKIYLGWVQPTEISPGIYSLNVVANLAASLSDTVILKVPLNSSEYYLIENRQRDVFQDGAKITYKSNGNIINRTFLKDTEGFYSYNTDSLSGVVLDVDEFDWALPGNGIVIWHIDQNVIDEKLAANKINNDINRRGVDVEEADGIQDIGERFITIFGDEVIGEGTDEDFWYAGNKADLFQNKFSKDTRPNTNTNSGANSLITIKDFSALSNRMSFKVEYGDSVIKPLFSSTVFSSLSGSSITPIESDPKLFAINSDSILVVTNGDSIIGSYVDFSDFKPASAKVGNNTYLIGAKLNNPAQQNPMRINFWYSNGISDTSGSFVVIDKVITTAPVIRKPATENYEVLFGTSDGEIIIYDLESLITQNPVRKNSLVIEPGAQVKKIATFNSKVFATATQITNNTKYDLVYNDGNIIKFNDEELLNISATVDAKGNDISILSSEKLGQYFFYVTTSDKILSEISSPSFEAAKSFALADLKNDGNNYILTTSGNKILAINSNGAAADNFPFVLNDGDEFIGLPLAADIEGDEKSEIIAFTKNGLVYTIDGGTGKVVDGFPISFGSQLLSDGALFYSNNKIGLAGLDQNKIFNGWSISSIPSRIDWAEAFGNGFNSSSLGIASETQKINSFFPTNRAYNYPNPVYNGQTAIRYFVNEDSKINIKIFDLAGDFVAELNANAQGGLDNETIWNVSDIQSGVYLARIEANGSSGKSESVVIKIAVVK
ncbi:MAG: T9SS type A sorting domain-containing protein [Ignavibacteriales bacterium]|nr:T9SS type A sorting domain-containing protein [Ignavibacteriales bacterium]